MIHVIQILGLSGSGKTTLYNKVKSAIFTDYKDCPVYQKILPGAKDKKTGKIKNMKWYYRIKNNVIIIDKPDMRLYRQGGDFYSYYLSKLPILIQYLENEVLDKEQTYVLLLASLCSIRINFEQSTIFILNVSEEKRLANKKNRKETFKNNMNVPFSEAASEKFTMNPLKNKILKGKCKYPIYDLDANDFSNLNNNAKIVYDKIIDIIYNGNKNNIVTEE